MQIIDVSPPQIENIIEVMEAIALTSAELDELCHAALSTMNDSKGFFIGFKRNCDGDIKYYLEKYFAGVLLIPERALYIAKFDNLIAGSIQLVFPNSKKETSSFSCVVENHFVAPWARGHGIATALLKYAEFMAKQKGFSLIKLSVRGDKQGAIKLYENNEYINWGNLPYYEIIDGQYMDGKFYYKLLSRGNK